MSETTEEARPERALPPSFGPRPGHLRRAEINRQVEALVHRLMMRVSGLDVVLDHGILAEEVRLDGALTMMLASHEPAARRQAARLAGDHLLDVGEKDDPTFWATDLGRAIAREIGWVGILPTRVIARNVLHVSRQGVDQMVRRGDLDAGSGQDAPCVTRRSLQIAAARRWPFESDV
jgi:hypothetical protein